MYGTRSGIRCPRCVDPQILDPETLDSQTLDPQTLDPQTLDPETLDCAIPDPKSVALLHTGLRVGTVIGKTGRPTWLT